MNGLTAASIVSAAIFFFAAAMSLNLAIAIYRRSEKSFLVDNLVVILLLFAVESAASLSSGIYGTGAWLDARTRHLLTNGAYAFRIAAVAAIVYFILSATRRMICGGIQLPGAPVPLAILRSKAIHLFFVLALFGSAGAAIGERIWRTLSMAPNARTGAFQLPPSFLEKPAGIAIGILGGIGVLAQCLTIAYARYTCMPGQTKTRKMRRLFAWKIRTPLMNLRDFFRTPAAYENRYDDEWKSWYLSTMLMLIFAGNHVIRAGQPRSITDMYWFLAGFGFLLSLLYFKMRFVFFDVLIKRGILLAMLVIAVCLYWYWGLLPLGRASLAAANPAAQILLWMGAVLFTLLWVFCYRRMDAALDRIVFHRADYDTLLPEIGGAIQRHIEPQSLISYVTGALKDAMDAESAAFSQSNAGPDPDSRNRQSDTAAVPMQTGNRTFGCLQLGKRCSGRKYMSQDLAFLDKVAGQTAGMLQNIELREEQELQRRREQQLKELASLAELKALKAQINPHFLYNAFNSLAALSRENPKAVEKSILDLSGAFRYALSASERDRVKLGEEADFLETYLAIEQIRFEERLRFRIDIPQELRECRIPPMIVQPLVENSVKHGISPSIAGGSVLVAARRIDSKLRISVQDDGAGFDLREYSPGNGGIGLQNVRSRIATLDPANHFHIESKRGAGTTVTIELPIEGSGFPVQG
jgi:two-component sensor histidine kinase